MKRVPGVLPDTIELGSNTQHSTTILTTMRRNSPHRDKGTSAFNHVRKMNSRPAPEALFYDGLGLSNALNDSLASRHQFHPIESQLTRQNQIDFIEDSPSKSIEDDMNIEWEDLSDSSADDSSLKSKHTAPLSRLEKPTFQKDVGFRPTISPENNIVNENGNATANLNPSLDPSITMSIKDRIKSFQIAMKGGSTTVSPSSSMLDREDLEYDEDQENGCDLANIEKSFSHDNNSTKSLKQSVSLKSNEGSSQNPGRNKTSSVQKSTSPVIASFLVPLEKYPFQPHGKPSGMTQSSSQLEHIQQPQPQTSKISPHEVKEETRQSLKEKVVNGSADMPTPGLSSSLIASWRQREANNVVFSRRPSANRNIDLETSSQPNVVGHRRSLSSNSLDSVARAKVGNLNKDVFDSQQQELLTAVMYEMEIQLDSRMKAMKLEMESEFNKKIEKIESKMKNSV